MARVYYVVSITLNKSEIDYICHGRKLLFKTLSVIMADNNDISDIHISYCSHVPYGAEPLCKGIWEYHPCENMLDLSDSCYYDPVRSEYVNTLGEGVPF